MRLISIGNVKLEDCLAKTIYDDNGRVLLSKGTVLQPYYIDRLIEMGIESLYIGDDTTATLEIDDIVSEGTRVQVTQITREALLQVRSGKSFESRKIRQAIGEIMDEVIQNRQLLIHLTDIRTRSGHTFGHSVNVCILSLLTALSMGYDQLKLRELGTGALLHDVGKAKLPDKLVLSTENWSEVDLNLIQKHAECGFQILRTTVNISAPAAHVAWQHHERFDGKGYPRMLKGTEIHEFARIVAVANTYDNLSTGRSGHKRILPHETVDIIRASQGYDLDPDIAKILIQNIAPFPIGTIVMLNNGCRGLVVDVKKNFPTRPAIKLLYDNNGQIIKETKVIDLLKELTVFVTEVVTD